MFGLARLIFFNFRDIFLKNSILEIIFTTHYNFKDEIDNSHITFHILKLKDPTKGVFTHRVVVIHWLILKHTDCHVIYSQPWIGSNPIVDVFRSMPDPPQRPRRCPKSYKSMPTHSPLSSYQHHSLTHTRSRFLTAHRSHC